MIININKYKLKVYIDSSYKTLAMILEFQEEKKYVSNS